MLRSIAAELRGLLDSDDRALFRLFPPAYEDDPEREAEYRSMVREDLIAQHAAALEIVQESADAQRLDEEQMTAWLGALNDLRLVIGTRLDVTEETNDQGIPPEDPRAPAFALYAYLTTLESHIVDALAESLGA